MPHARRAALDVQAPQHVGAVLHALREVLGLLFECEARFGTPRFRPAGQPVEHELSVAVGFTGDVEGSLALGMSRSTAVALAGTLGADQATAMAAMAGDGMTEVANILAGACAMTLHRRGYRLTVGLPAIAVDTPLAVKWPTAVVLEVPIELPQGGVAMALGMRVRGAITPAISSRPAHPPDMGAVV